MAFPYNRSIVAAVVKDPLESATRAKKLGADILELRMDLIKVDLHRTIIDIADLGLPIIITNRMKEEGGAWAGSEEERINELVSLIPLADAVDIELSAKKRDAVANKAKKAGKKLIISAHDFNGTPDAAVMEDIIKRSFEAGADIAKLAVMPRTLDDVLKLLHVTLNSNACVCTIAMGDLGKHSRVILPLYGSVMTYGYVDDPSAPGQFRVDELKKILKLF